MTSALLSVEIPRRPRDFLAEFPIASPGAARGRQMRGGSAAATDAAVRRRRAS